MGKCCWVGTGEVGGWGACGKGDGGVGGGHIRIEKEKVKGRGRRK